MFLKNKWLIAIQGATSNRHEDSNPLIEKVHCQRESTQRESTCLQQPVVHLRSKTTFSIAHTPMQSGFNLNHELSVIWGPGVHWQLAVTKKIVCRCWSTSFWSWENGLKRKFSDTCACWRVTSSFISFYNIDLPCPCHMMDPIGNIKRSDHSEKWQQNVEWWKFFIQLRYSMIWYP